jgi:hypothetical protein
MNGSRAKETQAIRENGLEQSIKSDNQRILGDYVFAALSLIGMVYTLFTYHVDMDDFFITLRYAGNIASGKGWVFNAGERVLGTTSPLLTFLVSLFIKSGLEGVLSIRLLCSLFLWGTSIFCYLYFYRKQQVLIGFAAGLLIFLVLPLKQLWGNEVPLCLFFLMGALYFFDREKWTLSAIFQCMYALSRMEGLLLFLICTSLLFWKKKRIVYPVLITGAILLVPWFIFSIRYFGDFFPNTLYAKARQGTRPDIWIGFSKGFFQTMTLIFLNKDWPFLSLCSLFGLAGLIRKRHALLLSWCAIHQFIYWLLGVPGSYSWYFYPLWLLYPMLMAGGVAFLVSGKEPMNLPLRGKRCFLYTALLGFLIFRSYHQPYTNTFYHNRHRLYLEVADYVRKSFPPDNKIIADEIGILGYYLKDYVILDTAGLIHKDIPKNAYFLYDHLVKTRNPDLIINCRYISDKISQDDLLQPVLINIGSGTKIRYSVEKVFQGDNLFVRILRRE